MFEQIELKIKGIIGNNITYWCKTYTFSESYTTSLPP